MTENPVQGTVTIGGGATEFIGTSHTDAVEGTLALLGVGAEDFTASGECAGTITVVCHMREAVYSYGGGTVATYGGNGEATYGPSRSQIITYRAG